jgi:hypothetical protein
MLKLYKAISKNSCIQTSWNVIILPCYWALNSSCWNSMSASWRITVCWATEVNHAISVAIIEELSNKHILRYRFPEGRYFGTNIRKNFQVFCPVCVFTPLLANSASFDVMWNLNGLAFGCLCWFYQALNIAVFLYIQHTAVDTPNAHSSLKCRILCYVDRASRYMRVMKPTWYTIYLQFIQSLYLYMLRAC